jgi:translocation and assembly module TamA
MGVVSTARVSAEGTPTPDLRIPVVAHVREAPLHTLKLGGGVGFDQVRQEVRLTGEWTDRNWLGGLRRLQLRATAGWAFIPSTLAVLREDIDEGPRDGPIFRTGADFDQPRAFGRPSLRGRSTLEGERTLEETYDALGGRAQAGVSWEPHSTFTLFPAYNLQGYWLNGPNTATVATAPLTLGCTSDPCFVLLSYLEEIVTWDTRDDRLEPRRGHFLSLSVQEGGGPLGGDFTYLRLLPEGRGYLTLGEDDRFTLAARVRLGTLITGSGRAEDSAVTTRFYSGGSMWMRGFSIRRLSPMVLIQTPGSSDPNSRLALPIGGNGLIEGSFEVRGRLSDTLVLAAFLDAGSVTRERQAVTEIHRMMWAVGFGVRYLTPVGPLRADLGVRLPFGRPPPLYDGGGRQITYERTPDTATMTREGKEDGSFVNDSCFGIGGSRRNTWVTDSLCAFHISIGEAF